MSGTCWDSEYMRHRGLIYSPPKQMSQLDDPVLYLGLALSATLVPADAQMGDALQLHTPTNPVKLC